MSGHCPVNVMARSSIVTMAAGFSVGHLIAHALVLVGFECLDKLFLSRHPIRIRRHLAAPAL